MKMNKSLVVLIAVTALTTLADFAIAQEKTQSRNPRYEKSYEHREFKSSTDGELKYGWMKPIQIKPDDKFPLVVCLHGAGGSVGASAVLAKPEMREKYPAFVMVPAADRPFTWAVTDVIKRPGGPTSYPEKLPVLIEAVKSLIQSEVIDPNRVYITGQSMGGVGSWGAIAKHPDLFAAAVPICGAWAVEEAAKMATVPVWAFHGDQDPTVPVKFSRELTDAITKAGGVAKYTEYPGVGHDSWTNAYHDEKMWQWLFAQRRTN